MARISPSPFERRLFDLFLSVKHQHKFNTVFRVAGGWVRDKLLVRQSDDIDIALDDMMGVTFAQHVNDHLKSIGEPTHSIGVVQANPDQSKHLETATVTVWGCAVDFVNLRCEEYSSTSRIPTIRIGTPSEDAFRRDFTINSMFYNINEDKVEDYTNMGLRDLADGIIRTPLPPLTTLIDDPLRVLRAVRFSSRFKFRMCEELVAAASSEGVQQALASKVSKERVGKEVEGMLIGKHPYEALRLLHTLGLSPVVFAPPPQFQFRSEHSINAATILNKFLNSSLQIIDQPNAETIRELYLCVFLLPHARDSYQLKSRPVPVTSHIIKNSLKLKNQYAEMIERIHGNIDPIVAVADALLRGPRPRSEIGGVLRAIGSDWRFGVLVAAVADYIRCSASSQDPWDSLVAKYSHLMQVIAEDNLEAVISLKPIMTGKEVAELLKLENGPGIGVKVREVVMWQIDNPSGTKAQCCDWLKSAHAN